ncbi:MAG: NUDIX hydrolase [Chloroflexi bacterium]|nr:NUDIX hydrolase [Chloroflexota bacterium]MDA1145507.1 NUDIX hydrolase [Chloroflexota bacterium]
MATVTPAFCPRCGGAIPEAAAGDRPTCPACGYVSYADPKVATGVLVSRPARAPATLDHTGGAGLELLLVRRNHEPALGRWAFPSGFVDAGEVVEEAAAREVREETNVEVQLDGLIGVYSEAGNPVVFIAFAGTHVAGEAVAGDEAFEVAWFSPDALPDLAFPHDGRVLEDWRASFAPEL